MLLWNERNSGREKKNKIIPVLWDNFFPELVIGIAVIYLSTKQIKSKLGLLQTK